MVRPDAAKLDEEHSYSFGTDDSSSEEIGIRSGQDSSLSLVGDGDLDLILMGTSAPWFPDVDEKAVKSITGVDC